ncbi:MAG TPA: hypothetical protein VE988_27100 [Gemmataceae bacterium]|nr:hypothetical protein [Gemmataceae bacterium]
MTFRDRRGASTSCGNKYRTHALARVAVKSWGPQRLRSVRWLGGSFWWSKSRDQCVDKHAVLDIPGAEAQWQTIPVKEALNRTAWIRNFLAVLNGVKHCFCKTLGESDWDHEIAPFVNSEFRWNQMEYQFFGARIPLSR